MYYWAVDHPNTVWYSPQICEKQKFVFKLDVNPENWKGYIALALLPKGIWLNPTIVFPVFFFSLVSEKAVILGRLHVSTDYIFISILTVFREFEYNLVCVLVIKTHQRLMPLQWCSKEPGHSGWWKNPHRREEGISKAKNISQHNYTSIFRNQRYIEAIYNYAFYVCVYLCRQTQIYNMYVCIYIHLYVHTRIYAIITYALYL